MNEKTKMVRDFYDIKQEVQPIIDRLDHQHLGVGTVRIVGEYATLPNTVDGMSGDFIPTSENMLIWIASQLDPALPWCRLRLNETCTSSAILERFEYQRYYSKEGGNQYGRQESSQEGNEEGEKVPEGKEVVNDPFITDDDIPF
jgi:6-pyruvoyl-tetrahydropterin synthase